MFRRLGTLFARLRSRWRESDAWKVDVIREYVGSRVIFYVGTRSLFGYEGLLVELDADRRAVRIVGKGGEQWLLLDQITAIAGADGTMIATF